jgi:hypothetical protein
MQSYSAYTVNNPHQLIAREQNYMIDRKLVSIHTEDRDIRKFPNPNEFDITLPQTLLNVQSLRLVQSALPNDYYTFSNEYQNTKFRFTYYDIDTTPLEPYTPSFCCTIQEGTYTACQLATELTNVMNNALQADTYILYKDTFSVYYDVVGKRFWFGNTRSKFSLDFDYKIEYFDENWCRNNTQPDVWNNYIRWGLPYYLGYDKLNYVATTVLPQINYLPKTNNCCTTVAGDEIMWMAPLSPKVINIQGEQNIYMEVDKYNSYDEIYPYTESNNNSFDNNAYAGKVNSAFAKIPIDSDGLQDSRNLFLINYVQYEPPIERIAKLRFRFRFHDGRLVDFRGLDFNFTIEFNSLRSEILRNKNIRVPAMINT